MKYLIMSILLVLVINPVQAKLTKQEQANCKYYDEQIEVINKRLRKTYKEPTGNRLRKQRKEYKDLRYKNC